MALFIVCPAQRQWNGKADKADLGLWNFSKNKAIYGSCCSVSFKTTSLLLITARISFKLSYCSEQWMVWCPSQTVTLRPATDQSLLYHDTLSPDATTSIPVPCALNSVGRWFLNILLIFIVYIKQEAFACILMSSDCFIYFVFIIICILYVGTPNCLQYAIFRTIRRGKSRKRCYLPSISSDISTNWRTSSKRASTYEGFSP